MIDKNMYYWERGKIYEFDNTRLHGVYNNSNEYRIHLVINLYNLSDEQLI
jgi:aspartyl/asparaginyl beta-hydroxylase (cupin superfamily)